MSKKIERIVSVFVVMLMLVSLSACGTKDSEVNGGKAVDSDKTAAVESETEIITLNFWHLWSDDTDPRKAIAEGVVKEWNDNHPYVQVVAEGTANESYKTKIKTAIAANEAPDIFKSWGAGFSQPFVDAEKVLALDEYLDESTNDRLISGSLTNFTYNDKIYGLPSYQAIGVFFCNEELFLAHDVKIPETFDELLVAVEAFSAAGVTPIAVGEKDKWPGMFYYNILALREGGAQLSNDALNNKASFEAEPFISAASKLEQLVDAGAFDEACLGLTKEESEVPFLNGEIPMYFNGNWTAGAIEQEGSAVKGKIVAKRFPSVDGASGSKNEFLGGAIDTFMVNADTQYKEESVAFVEFFSEKIAEQIYADGIGLPAWKVDVDESNMSPLNIQISEMLKEATGFVTWWDIYLEGADAEKHKDLVQSIFGKQITPEEFGEKMQEINTD
jgi:raffinose/stachyose/melibiose transport system substrate-binding protein